MANEAVRMRSVLCGANEKQPIEHDLPERKTLETGNVCADRIHRYCTTYFLQKERRLHGPCRNEL